MDDEDLGTTSTTFAPRPRPRQKPIAGTGDETGFGTLGTAPSSFRPPARPPADESGFETVEGEGDPSEGGLDSEAGESGGLHDEITSMGAGGEGGEESDTAEATADQLGRIEGGEESAEADLETIEGYERRDPAEGAEEGFETLAEAGVAIEGGGESSNAEFAFLAALVPTLVTTFGPPLAKALMGRLSPRARRRVTRIAGSVVPAAGGAARAGQLGSIASLAKALVAALGRGGGESDAEVDEAMVSEAAAQLEVIIGRDDRLRIRPTTKTPWKRFCALRISFPSGRSFRGTGFLVGPRAVVTAGHCVYLHSEGGWAKSVEVIPAMDGAARPFGSAKSSNLRSVRGWVSGKKPESDYGCVVLPQGAFNGRNLGRFGFAALDAAALVARPAVLAGYPGDKPFAELWGMRRQIKTVTAKTLIYDIDTFGGQSGAPVYLKRKGVRYVVGIHNYGAATGNSATRVTKPVYARLKAWSEIL